MLSQLERGVLSGEGSWTIGYALIGLAKLGLTRDKILAYMPWVVGVVGAPIN